VNPAFSDLVASSLPLPHFYAGASGKIARHADLAIKGNTHGFGVIYVGHEKELCFVLRNEGLLSMVFHIERNMIYYFVEPESGVIGAKKEVTAWRSLAVAWDTSLWSAPGSHTKYSSDQTSRHSWRIPKSDTLKGEDYLNKEVALTIPILVVMALPIFFDLKKSPPASTDKEYHPEASATYFSGHLL
jgi:hypothetical protein